MCCYGSHLIQIQYYVEKKKMKGENGIHYKIMTAIVTIEKL